MYLKLKEQKKRVSLQLTLLFHIQLILKDSTFLYLFYSDYKFPCTFHNLFAFLCCYNRHLWLLSL